MSENKLTFLCACEHLNSTFSLPIETMSTKQVSDRLEMKCDMGLDPDSQRTTFLPSVRFVLSSVPGPAGRAVQTVARMIEFLGTSEPLSFSVQRGLVRRGLDGRGEHA